MAHKWTSADDDEALALYLARADAVQVRTASKRRAIPEAAMKMRMQNFRSLHVGGGLGNVSAQSKARFERWLKLRNGPMRGGGA